MSFDRFLKDYIHKGLIKPQKTDFKTIERNIRRSYKELLAAEANLKIDEGVAFTVAYTAMLHAARALMFIKGYRPVDGYQHKTVVEFSGHVLGNKYKTAVIYFDRMRRKRNMFTYEINISISLTEVRGAISTAKAFIRVVRGIIEKSNPQYKFQF